MGVSYQNTRNNANKAYQTRRRGAGTGKGGSTRIRTSVTGFGDQDSTTEL